MELFRPSNGKISDPRSFAIVGAAMAVHRRLGYGFLESVYQEALQLEFRRRSIPHGREVEIRIIDAGVLLDGSFKADFVAYSKIVVELKAVAALTWPHKKQVINYLKATGMPLGLILNFGAASLEWRRVINTPTTNPR